MAYRLKPGRPLAGEMRRLLDRQLCLAISQLRQTGNPRADDEIHAARRHVKKARAVIRLFEATLGKDGRAANERLRTVSRMLAPIADGEAVVDTLARVTRRYPRALAPETRRVIRAALIHRETRIDEQARRDRVVETARALLRSERRRLPAWPGDEDGFHVITAGLKRTYRAARARARATARDFTAENCHAWRRRVKDQWYHLRLLERRGGRALSADRRALEALDGWLGEYQTAVVLEGVLASSEIAPEGALARCAGAVRRYRRTLGRDAGRLGRRLYREKPGQFVARVHAEWRAVNRRLAPPNRSSR